MQNLSIRFMIGLAVDGESLLGSAVKVERRANLALAILAETYPAFTSTRGAGYWRGAPEPNLVAEVIVPDSDLEVITTARRTAARIAAALDQESVAVAVANVTAFALVDASHADLGSDEDADRFATESDRAVDGTGGRYAPL